MVPFCYLFAGALFGLSETLEVKADTSESLEFGPTSFFAAWNFQTAKLSKRTVKI